MVLIKKTKIQIIDIRKLLSKTLLFLTDKEYSPIRSVETACNKLKTSSETLYKAVTLQANQINLARKVRSLSLTEIKKFDQRLLLDNLEKQSKELIKQVQLASK